MANQVAARLQPGGFTAQQVLKLLRKKGIVGKPKEQQVHWLV